MSCRYRELKERREEKVHEREMVRVRLEQNTHHRHLETLQQLRNTIGQSALSCISGVLSDVGVMLAVLAGIKFDPI